MRQREKDWGERVGLSRAGLTAVLVLTLLAGGVAPGSECAAEGGPVLVEAHFDVDAGGFVFYPDAFGTSQPAYATGSYQPTAGYSGGGLQVTVGGVDGEPITGMSGGWRYVLQLATGAGGVAVSLRYRMTTPTHYEYDEFSRVLVSVDGVLHGRGSRAYVDHIGGDGDTTGPELHDTLWQEHELYIGDLAAGSHTLVIGAYNNHKDQLEEVTTLVLDDLLVSRGRAVPLAGDPQTLVNRLSLARFKNDIQIVAALGNRCRFPACEPYTSFGDAQAWVDSELRAMGYATELRSYNYLGYSGTNLWATKVGTTHPESMYLVTAHLDGAETGRAADDNGSGVALVLNVARALAAADVTTGYSVRFVFWDQEEIGSIGSGAYVVQRYILQGIENPEGSGLYPEPNWLGNLTHDTLLYDHGVGVPGEEQSACADLDVEWRAGTAYAAESMDLALTWRFLSGTYAANYPANAADWSSDTDDSSFHDRCPSVSIRENRRGVPEEWINPFYHQWNDVYGSYLEDDFRLGFNAVQATLGVIAGLAGARVNSINHRPSAVSSALDVDRDAAREITLSGSDPDGDDLFFDVLDYPLHGMLSGMAPDLTYTPDPGYTGSDSLTFTVTDGELVSDLAAVTLTVSAPGVPALGEVNRDGVVNSTDALIVLSADAGISTLPFCPLNCGDVSGDGQVNSTDALILLSFDAGMSVPFAIGQPGCPVDVIQPPGCD